MLDGVVQGAGGVLGDHVEAARGLLGSAGGSKHSIIMAERGGRFGPSRARP